MLCMFVLSPLLFEHIHFYRNHLKCFKSTSESNVSYDLRFHIEELGTRHAN